MSGSCDFCPQAGRLATCMCVHEHRVGVWVCPEKHDAYLAAGEIGCRICEQDVTATHQHWCQLSEVTA